MNLFTIKTNFNAMVERYGNSLQASFDGSNRFEEIKNRLIFLHENRKSDYLFNITGKTDGVELWYFVLVDCGKQEELLGKNDAPPLDPAHFGKILESGRGLNVPQTVYNKMNKFIKDLKDKLLVHKLQESEIYYVLCDDEKKSEIAASRTAEEVGRCGKILYSSMYEDPPEALWDVIEKGYFDFGLTRGSINLSRSSISRGGDVSQAQFVLEEVGHIDWTDRDGWTMLHHAAHFGDLNMITNLKDMNADTQVRDKICGRKPIHIAAREGHTKAVELLMDSVDDMDKSGWTPSHYAAWKGDSNTVKYLILKKANTDIRDWYLGQKPIHVAATEGHKHIVQILLDNGADIDDVDFKGRTLLYHSVLAGRFEMAEFLIDRNANINIATKSNTKPIHVSAELDHAKIAELLLNHGADIKSQTSTGYTPLHWAADGGSIEVVQFLVEKGADLNVVDNQGKTPFDIAMAEQHFENASYLAEKMFEMFQEQDNHSEAFCISEKLLKIQVEKLSQDDHKVLRTQHNIALMCYELGKYEEALETFNVTLSKRQDVLGPHHYHTLCTKYEKGRVLVTQWKLEEAMDIFKEVYESWKDTLGAGHHRTLSVTREIAFVHFKKCEFDEALKICEDIYEKRKLSSGVYDPVTLQALEDVAIVLVNKGENQNAFRFLKDVFEKRKSCLGIHHPETRSTVYHIATVQRRLKEATGKRTCCMQ